jgi:hypothetical protein
MAPVKAKPRQFSHDMSGFSQYDSLLGLEKGKLE